MPSSSAKIAALDVVLLGCLHVERDPVEEFEDLASDDAHVRVHWRASRQVVPSMLT